MNITGFFNKKSVFVKEFKDSWWVILTILFSFLVFQGAMKKKEKEVISLKQNHTYLLAQKTYLEKENTELQLEIQSQLDPEYIELTLKKVLGLVEEGETKVQFQMNF